MRITHLSYAFLCGFLATILGLQWWQIPGYPMPLWLTMGCLAGLGAACRKPVPIVMTLGCAIAFWTVGRTTHTSSLHTLDWYANASTVEIVGVIAEEPDKRPELTRYTIAAETVTTASGSFAVHGNVLATDRNGWPEYAYGDRVTVKGKLEKPGPVENFRYDNYLSRYGVYSVIFRATFTPTGPNEGNAFFRELLRAKAGFEERIATYYPEPGASLLLGLLTGSRRGIPTAQQEDFQTTGLTHLVAISGYNITMLLTILSMLFFWLPLRWRFFPSVAIIVLFCLFTGSSASVVRAGVMGILGLIALQLGRTQTMRLTVAWTLFFMLAWNPKQLWYDAGFQLSFLSLLGVMEVSPFLVTWTKKIPELFGMRQSMVLTLSAQVTTVPWMLLLFDRMSLIAPVANVFAPPLVPYAMLFGFLSVALGAVASPLGTLLSIPAHVALSTITWIAAFLAKIPMASVGITGISSLAVAGYYAALALAIIKTTHTSAASSPEPSALPPARDRENETCSTLPRFPDAIPQKISPAASA